MTTPTTAEVGHGSKVPTVAEIDGFRGRLISADHEVRHRATAAGSSPRICTGAR
jgi:hypothetical protein